MVDIIAPHEKTRTGIILRKDLDTYPEIEEQVAKEEQDKIIYTILMILLFLFLINLYAW